MAFHAGETYRYQRRELVILSSDGSHIEYIFRGAWVSHKCSVEDMEHANLRLVMDRWGYPVKESR